MILAAGRGERMGTLTALTPKPLLPIAGKPLLQYHIDRLRAAGISEIVINASYLGAQIQSYIAETGQSSLISVLLEPQRLETGGGIHNALSLLGGDPFVVVNGDVWTDYPLASLALPSTDLAHLVLVPNPAHNPDGDFHLMQDRLQESGGLALTFSGVSVLSPELFAGQAAGAFPLAPLLRRAIKVGRVSGECYTGTWIDVGTPDRLALVERIIREQV